MLEDERYESWSPRCNGDAWHQGGLVVQVVGIACGWLQREFGAEFQRESGSWN